MYDTPSRIDINDSYLNLFNFFWTSFTYLPSFFFFSLIVSFFLYNLVLPISLLLTYFLYNIELFDFIATNFNFINLDLNLTSINLLLTNNLNKYHPFIFYISTFLLFILYWINLNLNLNKTFVYNLNSYLLFFYNNYIISINLFALFLGSWWALQEGTWGGWWNWDPSEVFGLLVSLFTLFLLHQSTSNKSTFKNSSKIKILFFFVLITYFFIQLNFDLVSHNFGTKFFFFFNNNLFFLEMIYLLTIIIGLIFFKNYLTSNKILTSTNYKLKLNGSFKNYYITTLLVLVAFFIIFLSFSPLLNYFLWNFFHINSLNLNVNYNLLIFFVMFTPLLVFSQSITNCYLLIISGISIITQTPIIILSFLYYNSFKFYSINHLFLIIFIIINIISYNFSFIYWDFVDLYSPIKLYNNFLNCNYNITVCNHYLQDTFFTFFTTSGSINLNSNIYYTSNSTSIQTFLLNYNSENFLNYYLLSLNWFDTYIFIETNYLNNLYDIIVLTIIFILSRFSQINIYKFNI